MRYLALLILFGFSDVAHARAQPRPLSNVDALLGVHDVLHAADMISTTLVLTRGRNLGASERNPFLRAFAGSPVALTAVSSTIDVFQVTIIKRVEREHPRWALAWAAALVAVEVWATTNNIAAAGRLHQRRVAAMRNW